MNIEIIHKDSKLVRVVPELSDLLFEEGWRFVRVVSTSYAYTNGIEDSIETISSNLDRGYTNVLTPARKLL